MCIPIMPTSLDLMKLMYKTSELLGKYYILEVK